MEAPRGQRGCGLPQRGARDSIPRVGGSAADPRDSATSTCCPRRPQLIAWRAVFQNLLAGAWDPAHRLARMISSTYNVVEFTRHPHPPDLPISAHGGRARPDS